jgi:hypothetical protein
VKWVLYYFFLLTGFDSLCFSLTDIFLWLVSVPHGYCCFRASSFHVGGTASVKLADCFFPLVSTRRLRPSPQCSTRVLLVIHRPPQPFKKAKITPTSITRTKIECTFLRSYKTAQDGGYAGTDGTLEASKNDISVTRV